jgi:hypothetical protein
MGWNRWQISALAILTILAGSPADAQQIQGTPGSPSATETIDSKYLPPDTRTPVDDKDYQVPFRFTGKVAKVTIRVGPEQLAEADRQVMDEALRRAKD